MRSVAVMYVAPIRGCDHRGRPSSFFCSLGSVRNRDRLLTSALPECTADTDHSQDRDRCEQSNKQALAPGHEPLSGAVPLVCLCHSTFHGLAEKANGIHQRLIGLSWLKHLAKLCLQRLPVVFSQDTALFRLGENASNKS